MTNREWLNSLTDEEFASWVCDVDVYDLKNNVYVHPTPKWNRLMYQYNDSKGGLLLWLKQEREND